LSVTSCRFVVSWRLCVFRARFSFLCIRIYYTAQDFAFPVGLVNRPAVHGPLVLLDHLGPAVVMDIALTFLLSRLQMTMRRPGVTPPPVDVIVIDDGEDGRRR